MAKRATPAPALKPPSIKKAEGRRRLTTLIKRGETLLAQRPLKEGQEHVWSTACIETIEATFGEGSGHLDAFIGQVRMMPSHGSGAYDAYADHCAAESMMRRIDVLKTLVEQVDLEIGFEEPPATSTATFWSDIHPSISSVAKIRYDTGQFADCVEAAFKEVNSLIKNHFKQRTGRELDGAPLMTEAFSPKNPWVVLDDLGTESGRNVQQGYMQLYAGSMTGVRNPKAHANVTIDDIRARHFLYLASLLAYRFDERL